MKPIRLRVKGCTAFVDEVDLQFERLELFAIVGPTGAGKSSLLQAMCIALFGKAPKVGDDLRQLVSPAAERAIFFLEFLAGGRRYRVSRASSVQSRGRQRPRSRRGEPTTSGPR